MSSIILGVSRPSVNQLQGACISQHEANVPNPNSDKSTEPLNLSSTMSYNRNHNSHFFQSHPSSSSLRRGTHLDTKLPHLIDNQLLLPIPTILKVQHHQIRISALS